VFRSDSEENEELGFADAYKYDILKNREPKKDNSYKKLLIILSFILSLSSIGLFGYIYLNNYIANGHAEEVTPPEESVLLNNVDELSDEDEGDISDINQTGEIDEVNETTPTILDEEVGDEEENYIEDLAKLSDE
jgi:hypothetical protein